MARLLIAYDGSEPAAAAIRAAARLFAGAEATVLVAHEEPPSFAGPLLSRPADPEAVRPGLEALAGEITRRALATAAEGVALARADGLVAEPMIAATDGGVWAEVITAARDRAADVIVCGTRGHGGLGRALLGSTASSVLHHAERSVLVVPEPDSAAVPAGPVLIAYDGSPDAQAAVAIAATLFAGQPATVLHAWRSAIRDSVAGRALLSAGVSEVHEIAADLEGLYQANALALAQDGRDLALEHGLQADAALADADHGAWPALTDAAEAADARVVVAGSRGRGGVATALLGSVSGALVANARRPTLLPSQRRPPGWSSAAGWTPRRWPGSPRRCATPS